MENPSDKARQAILAAMLAHVPFDGWTRKALLAAVSDTDLPDGADALYFPNGPLELINFWSSEIDKEVAEKLSALDLSSMKIRDKVTAGVIFRLEALGRHEEAAKRAMARAALPDSLGDGPRHLWAAADTVWRAIGDTSTDANYYSKRTILSGVIGSSTLAWLADETPDKTKGRKFVDDRIANVMQFESLKWRIKKNAANWPSPAGLMGRLRYGRRARRRSMR